MLKFILFILYIIFLALHLGDYIDFLIFYMLVDNIIYDIHFKIGKGA